MKFPDKRSSSEEGRGPREKQRVSQPETEKEQMTDAEGGTSGGREGRGSPGKTGLQQGECAFSASEPTRRMPAEGPTALATWRLLVTLERAALGGEEGC